ncbi:pimeloyl-ACP methyl ester carboxylesterase [Antricoccus suffuscus]|uniref:Pimeloyl-ACP methyl ester carboxylesterase n=1 Tax=Antricoccus suffuscus TaxID=1629062 RepID=A0A2T0YY45_9ACTN|nr:alpha/beta hydrolase [Antricoccus suffuscus]PRZ29025.1 pimeloyl-ACP methyl ester carboxylesterase [Antricoccus suffuscus]
METTERTIEANGIAFSVIEAGDGPLALLLHGFPDHNRSWIPLITSLADAGWHAVAPAMRGYSPTGPAPDGCYQAWALGSDAVALIEALGHDSAVLIGHDWGASAAYAATRQAPERVSKLVTMSVPHGPQLGKSFVTNAEQQRRSWYMFFFQMPFAELAVQHEDFVFIDRLWAEWSPGYDAPAAERAALKHMFAGDGVLTNTLAYYRQTFSPTPDHPEWAARQAESAGPITVPTLYLHGADDGCIGPEVSEGMDASFPAGLRRIVVPNAGHFLQVEQPEVVAEHVTAFLGAP